MRICRSPDNGPSPSGKARDFDSRIPLVRIQLEPAKKTAKNIDSLRSFGIGGSYARCAAFLFFSSAKAARLFKARLGARRFPLGAQPAKIFVSKALHSCKQLLY